MVQKVAPKDKDASHQTWQPEFVPQELGQGRRLMGDVYYM